MNNVVFSSALSLLLIPLYTQHMLSTWPCLEFWKYKGEVGKSLIYTHQTSKLTCTCTWSSLDPMPLLPDVLWIPRTTHRNHLGSFNNDWCLGPNSENLMSLVLSAGWESEFLKCLQGHLNYSQDWDLISVCSPSQASAGNLTLTWISICFHSIGSFPSHTQCLKLFYLKIRMKNPPWIHCP